MTARPVLPNALARRVFLDRHALLTREGGSGSGADLAGLIDRLGFVQLDSVTTFARAHDLILWSRRGQYRPAALDRLHARDRCVFEHWTHDASVIPTSAFVHWRHRFETDRQRLTTRWQEWRRDGFLDLLDEVRRRVSDHGECTSGDVGTDEKKASGGWWDWHPSKTALEYLWRTGELSVKRRDGFRKVYDLTERVIAPEHLNARTHRAESVAWACGAALDRLGFATSGDLAAFFDLASPAEARDWCAAALASGEIEEIEVEGADGGSRRSFARPGLLEAAMALPDPGPRVRILSPFDPMLRDRARAERLFGFAYRIEIFVPAPKRRYGYYVFPVWEGDRAIGRIDMKVDRDRDVLGVTAFWSEPGIAMGKGRLARLVTELDRAAVFAGVSRVAYADGWLRTGDGQIG
jgi:uncharacterized protein YcaQ